MSGMEKMWIELTGHQPIADARGYGTQWQRMCELKTQEAADVAGGAAWDAAVVAWNAAVIAAATEAAWGAGAAWAAARAIECTQKENELGEQV